MASPAPFCLKVSFIITNSGSDSGLTSFSLCLTLLASVKFFMKAVGPGDTNAGLGGEAGGPESNSDVAVAFG